MTGSARVRTHVVDGLSVVRRRAEPPSEHAVLLVHGAMDRAASFGRVMRRLDGVQSIAVDRRGYAGSLDAGTATTVVEHARDLVTVLDECDTSRVVVVGHSLGGRIALELAALGDPRVRAVVVFELPMPELDGSRARVGGGAIEIGRADGPAAAAEHFYRRMVGDGTWDRLRDADRRARRSEGAALLAELVDLRDQHRVVDLDAVTVPVTIGVGGRSAPALRSGALALHDALGRSRLVELPGAGHGAHLTHPGEFAAFVTDSFGSSEDLAADGARSHRSADAR